MLTYYTAAAAGLADGSGVALPHEEIWFTGGGLTWSATQRQTALRYRAENQKLSVSQQNAGLTHSGQTPLYSDPLWSVPLWSESL